MPALSALAPLLAKGGSFAAKLIAPEALVPLLIAQLVLGKGLDVLGAKGDRDIARKQIEMQERMAKLTAEAAKKATIESQARSESYMRQTQENALMQQYQNSQDQQMALLLQAMQGMSNTPRPSYPSGGMVGLMRSAL
jgi:hypothetical protein